MSNVKVFLKLFFNFFVVSLFFGQLVYSADSYKINNGASQVINEHGVRKNVVNNCAQPILVPTKTSAEWVSSFIPNKPGCVGVYCPAGDSCSGTTDCDGNDNYYMTGTQSSTSTSYCRFEDYADVSNVCDGVGGCVSGTCNSVSTSTQATAGTCKFISGCTGSTSGTVSNYGTSTTCSGVQDCDSNNYYFQSGTQSSTSTSYCRYRDYADRARYCNGAGSCAALSCSSYSDSTQATAGTCKYISSCSGSSPGTVSNYGTSTTCSGVQDCDSNNYYFQSGTQSATSTSYCRYRDYADRARYCNGAGSCAALSCSSYSDSTQATAGTCKYISSCSGSSPGTVSNYATGTACSGNTDCDSLDSYSITGTQSATSTSYCRFTNYADTTNVCNSGSCVSGTCSNPSVTTQATAGTCKYISSCSSSSQAVANYNSGTACSGTTDCDGNNYYFQSGSNSATSTSYCRYRDYADKSNVCNGSGSCVSASCNSYSDSTVKTAGTCKYISSCSGGSSGTVNNYGTSTTCSSVQDCDNNNYYYRTGTQSATSTSYCYYRDYADRARYCNGAGSCAALSCSSYSNSLKNTAGTCKYISSCSGSSPGSVSNYADGTSCGTGKVCQSGSCVDSYTYSWYTGAYGTCPSYECGTKYKYRTVYCRRSDGTQVADSFCSGTKPSTSASCGTRSCSGNGICGGPPHCVPGRCGSPGFDCY